MKQYKRNSFSHFLHNLKKNKKFKHIPFLFSYINIKKNKNLKILKKKEKRKLKFKQ